MMDFLSEKEFLSLSQQGNLIPVYRNILGDLETPVGAYHKLSKHARFSFLLESVEGEEKFSRYSFIAAHPDFVLRIKNKNVEMMKLSKGVVKVTKSTLNDSPMALVRELMKDIHAVTIKGLPQFYGGMVGFLSYDCVRYFERLPDTSTDDLDLPDVSLMMANDLMVFDHRHHMIQVISCVRLEKNDGDAEKIKKYRQAIKRIEAMIATLKQPMTITASSKARKSQALKVKSNMTQAQFENMVKTAKTHITAGDIFQIVLSQRFSVDIKVSAFDIYRSLRVLNPSPYMFFLNLDGFYLVGASPELLVRCIDGKVETRPIAGTRWRGETLQEDERLQKELLADPKEKAEHIMLVDLGRNDLGRVCKQGSVQLSEFMAIEKYSHVMHICSNVQGQLAKDKDALNVLEAAFPAGTVSGAPKIRAMEIIERLEGQKRGPYAGAVGYVSFSKNLDTCITIRTIVVRGEKAYVQAGAGIVADSDPSAEYKESVNKAKGQIKAIEMAHG